MLSTNQKNRWWNIAIYCNVLLPSYFQFYTHELVPVVLLRRQMVDVGTGSMIEYDATLWNTCPWLSMVMLDLNLSQTYLKFKLKGVSIWCTVVAGCHKYRGGMPPYNVPILVQAQSARRARSLGSDIPGFEVGRNFAKNADWEKLQDQCRVVFIQKLKFSEWHVQDDMMYPTAMATGVGIMDA